MRKFHHAQLDELPPVACCCGTSRRAFVELPGAPASAHLLETHDEALSHYHQKTTELYLVLEGEGFLELDGELLAVRPLSAVMILPGCRHRVLGQMKIVNIPVPGHDEADFFFAAPAPAKVDLPDC